MQHKIKYEDVLNEVPQFGDTKNRLVNYSITFEIMEGFTASRRDYNFNETNDQMSNRLDISYGVKFTWMLPFYHRSNSKERYYTD